MLADELYGMGDTGHGSTGMAEVFSPAHLLQKGPAHGKCD